MSEVVLAGPVAYLSESKSSVFFSKTSASAGAFNPNPGTATPVKKLQSALSVAMWGEDNRFPQNIEQQMAYCGLGKSALDWKARALFGNGIVPGRILGDEDEGKKEIFQPLDRTKYKHVYNFLQSRSFFRFMLEFLQDWTWYGNCFPEMLLSKDAKTISGFVHQESCDSRFKQMNDDGEIDTVYLSKMWGMAANQFARFDPAKRIKNLVENPQSLTEIDGKFLKQLDCIDMYDPIESLKVIAKSQVDKYSVEFKSAILPVNYPSVNKTYYQVPAWDGARLSGWIEIAAKQPALIKALIEKAYKIKYHIEIPESYFERQYGFEEWHSWSELQQTEKRKKLLKEMDDFLAGAENAHKTFISFFDVDPQTKKEYGQVKITVVEDKTTVEKDLVIGSAAGVEILIAMGVHPSLFSAGATGSMYRSGGGSGSDIREAYLVYTSLLNLERNVLLEPLYLVRDYNREVGGEPEWEEDIVFRFRDTVLTTLDQGKGTEKKLS